MTAALLADAGDALVVLRHRLKEAGYHHLANKIDPVVAAAAIMTPIDDGVPDTYPTPSGGWTCFHCGETFRSPRRAREHFGAQSDRAPGCLLKVEAGDELGWLRLIRRMESTTDDQWARAEAAEGEGTALSARLAAARAENRSEERNAAAGADLFAALARDEARLAALDWAAADTPAAVVGHLLDRLDSVRPPAGEP